MNSDNVRVPQVGDWIRRKRYKFVTAGSVELIWLRAKIYQVGTEQGLVYILDEIGSLLPCPRGTWEYDPVGAN